MRQFRPALLRIAILATLLHTAQAFSDEVREGRVVWWGRDVVRRSGNSGHTNGVIEIGNEILSNGVAIAARSQQGLVLKSDGTVFSFGLNFYDRSNVPIGLSNVASIIVEGSSCWAIKHDSTVSQWGGDQDRGNIVSMLTNISTIAWASYRSYLGLKTDGSLIGLRFDVPDQLTDPETGLTLSPEKAFIRPVKVGRQVLTNIAAIATLGRTQLVLQRNGGVFRLELDYRGGYTGLGAPPFAYGSIIPIEIDGERLRNVTAIAGSGLHVLALKRDGSVTAWGNNSYGESVVPAGLSDVIAIAAAEHVSLALKSDGTVAAWGGNHHGQTSVPAGLSNVIAIAAGGFFSLAITTGAVPASVFIPPRGRLEEMARKADLVFKGRVLSSVAITNDSFPHWGKPHATQLEVISVLQGSVPTNVLIFQHNTSGPMLWSGGTPPAHYVLEKERAYLIFATKTERPGVFRQLPSMLRSEADGVTLILDTRPLPIASVKEAHWLELNRMLTDTNPTNQIYAIERLDRLSRAGRRDDSWSRSDDFQRTVLLQALLPLTTNNHQQVALRAISCFAVESNAAVRLEQFVEALTHVANESASAQCRLQAIDSLSGLRNEAVSNALARLLIDPDDSIRVGAVRFLPRFSADFLEPALRQCAADESANVRSVVADVIGEGKYTRLLPTLQKLFRDPVGKDPLIKPLTMEHLKAGLRWSNIGDVHTSAGMALVKFPPSQVADFLKANLDDSGFHINFVAKLAQGDAEPWLPELVKILRARLAQVDNLAKTPPLDPKRLADPQAEKVLIGAYTKCWEDIRQYLLQQSPRELASGKFDRYMDLLEKTIRPVPGCTVQEARWLYELYWTKGTAKRVGQLRRQYDKTDDWWFDAFNKGIRGEADPVSPITF